VPVAATAGSGYPAAVQASRAPAAPGARGSKKHAKAGVQPYSSYEEHLEKAARLNNEMQSQYNQVYAGDVSYSYADRRH
jgi:hypothetical protein